jgi:hypothetical protein
MECARPLKRNVCIQRRIMVFTKAALVRLHQTGWAYPSLGRFASEHEAARAYDNAAFAAWGEYAFLNFPIKEAAA